ncbi:MAG TPA: hypothetical protein ENO31_00240 [Thermoprotei archaeon]|nr:hypothetical protein [Thermoprotei archaeon]
MNSRPDEPEVYDHVGFKWSFEVEVNEFFDAVRQHKDTISNGRESLLDIQLAEKWWQPFHKVFENQSTISE